MPAAARAAAPLVSLWRADNLARARERLAHGDAALRPAYDALLSAANEALAAGPFSVMDKQRTPPSGDKHDYMSLAPYWWPDSTKPEGLPFIRRDGDVNPESRRDTDSPRFGQMSNAAETLALAYYFSNDPRYARRAGLILRTWFLNPATRMNPNLRFAQAIPGVTEGRGIGIIDTRDMTSIVDDVALLRGAPGWSVDDERAMRDWCRTYLSWLQTSVQGREEAAAKNNHGTWYDAQTASLALFVGDTSLARHVIGVSAKARLAAQIAPDGKQPEELARTRPLHYSLFNLEPFGRLAELGRHVGVDLWHYDAPTGASLHRAIAFVAPYFAPAAKWPGPEITPANPEDFLKTIRQAAEAYHDPSLDAAIHAMRPIALSTDRSRLLYPATSEVRQSTAVPPADLRAVEAHAMQYAAHQLRESAEQLDPAAGYPRSTRPDGSWELAPATSWTSGFFAGSLWKMYAATHDTAWRRLAERWTNGLAGNDTRTDTHDLGFLIFTSFGAGYRLTGNPWYRAVIDSASRALATRFSDRVGAIKSWDTEQANDRRRSWRYPVIIDNMMNLEMLFWAAAHGGDARWQTIAERHALTSARAHVRDDGSTAHVALFDPATGDLLGRATWQGYSDSSVWARGQAWAIYGFTSAYEATRRPELLATARRVADWYVDHLPPDGVPFWDFSDPAVPNALRDASAAAVAAAGLLSLAGDAGGTDSARYGAAAERGLRTLSSRYLTERTANRAVLAHSVGGLPQKAEVDVGIVYADYYFIEALMKDGAVRAAGGAVGRP